MILEVESLTKIETICLFFYNLEVVIRDASNDVDYSRMITDRG